MKFLKTTLTVLASTLTATAAMGADFNLGIETFHSNIELKGGKMSGDFGSDFGSGTRNFNRAVLGTTHENAPGIGIRGSIEFGHFSLGTGVRHAKFYPNVDTDAVNTSAFIDGKINFLPDRTISPYITGLVSYDLLQLNEHYGPDDETLRTEYEDTRLVNAGTGIGVQIMLSEKTTVDLALTHSRTIKKGTLKGRAEDYSDELGLAVFTVETQDIEMAKTEATIGLTQTL